MLKSFRFLFQFAWINLACLLGFAVLVVVGCYATGVPGGASNLFATYYGAFPLVTLRLEEYPNRKDFLAALAARITAEEAEAVVMGLPLLDDGTDSLTTRQVRNVTERLKRRVDLPVFYMPELLSSEEAWSDLRDAGLTARKRKAVLDQQAAVRILASFLALPPEQRRPA